LSDLFSISSDFINGLKVIDDTSTPSKGFYKVIYDDEVNTLGLEAAYLLSAFRGRQHATGKLTRISATNIKKYIYNFSFYKIWKGINILRLKGYITSYRQGILGVNIYEVTEKGFENFRSKEHTKQQQELKGVVAKRPYNAKCIVPTIDDIKREIANKSFHNVSAEKFFNYYNAKEWIINGREIYSWKTLLKLWNTKNTT
jgi:DNA-binding PadR family transcriptional regulator